MLVDNGTHGSVACQSSRKLSASTANLLPPELWRHVLEQLPPSSLQNTSLALSRALPNAGVRPRDIFTAIRISRDKQAGQLIRRLGPRYEDAATMKRLASSFQNVAWRADSFLLVNAIALFPHLQTIDLNVGPLFQPENFDELVEIERSDIQRLSLRFNPYVDKASYTIFLKGLYFDSGVLRLAKWPVTPSLRHLSLVQDPIPSFQDLKLAAKESGTTIPTQAHAQPIVFFKLNCLSTLATSPVAAHISNVRLRVPGRSLLTAISTASTSSTVIPATHSATLPKPFPALEHLDISTTYVSCDGALQGLLKRHPGLKYLVVDRSGLIRFGMPEEVCKEIGRLIASIGVARATESAKVYRTALRTQQAQAAARTRARLRASEEANGGSASQENRPDLVMQEEIARARRGRSTYATERRVRSAHVGPSAAANQAAELEAAFSGLAMTSTATKSIILPSLPSLVNLACGVSHPEVDEDVREDWNDDFQEGFQEGIAKAITFIEERLEDYRRLANRANNATAKTSAEDRAHPKLMRFRTPEERKERSIRAASFGLQVEDLPEMQNLDILGTMDLVPCEISDAMALIDDIKKSQCTLCTLPDCPSQGRIAWTETQEEKDKAEMGRWRRPREEHTPGCAHLVGRAIWEDENGVSDK